MKQDTTLLANILSEKKELVRLFVIAAILAFSVGALASQFAAQTMIPVWATTFIAFLLILISFGLLAKDLKSSLSFEDEIDGVIFIDPKRNQIIPVKDYNFSEKLHQTLLAVKAESRSIFNEWEKDPIVPVPAEETLSDKVSESRVASSGEQPTYLSIFRVSAEGDSVKIPQAARLLQEAVSFVLLEELSLHLSTYFNDSDDDVYIKEYKREDIPSFLLKNRVLNLLSTPIEQRDIFLNAFPDGEERPEGELYSLWGSDGSMYSRFDLVLPNGTKIQHSEVGSIRIETKRLSIELVAKYSNSTAVVANAFLAKYVGKDPHSVECRRLPIVLRCQIKPLSLVTSSGWQYYRWLDSFRERLKSSFDFPTFQGDIHWQVIEPLLFSMRGQTTRTKPAKTDDAKKTKNTQEQP